MVDTVQKSWDVLKGISNNHTNANEKEKAEAGGDPAH